MKDVIEVKGMMCPKCEAHVEEALMKLDGVTQVKADRKKNSVTIKSENGINIDEAKKLIVEAGYEA